MPDCDAWAVQLGLCRLHYYQWPFWCYLNGVEIEERRVRPLDGYVEARVDGIWALYHRLVFTRELGRMLETSEIVAFIDGDPANVSRSNMVLTDRLGAWHIKHEREKA